MADLRNMKQSEHELAAHNNPSKIEENEPLTWMFWKKKRYIVVLLAFFGFFNVYSLRVNLSVAIVAMTENRTLIDENGTATFESDFNWNSKEKGLILSSFFYGYILTPLIGGLLSARLGGNHVFGFGIGATAVLTLLTPLAAKHSIEMLLAVRILEGIFEGVTFPCMHAVWARWSPPLERSRMASMAFAGNYAGTVIAMPGSGLLAANYGWESIFYVFGVIGLVWFIVWTIIVKAGPEEDRFCPKEEVEYIQATLGKRSTHAVNYPWKSIFTSKAVIAITVSHFAANWGFYTLVTLLPTFLKDSLHLDLNKTGFVSALPYLAMGLLLVVSGYLADWSQMKGYLTTTQVRKYFNCSSFLVQTLFMILAVYVADFTLIIVCITVAVGVGAFGLTGFAVNHLDIAPQHAGVLMGITNTFATIPGIVSPTLSGYIVQNKLIEEWRIVFFIASGIYLFGCITYWNWASGELQDWAKPAKQIQHELDEESQLKKNESSDNEDV